MAADGRSGVPFGVGAEDGAAGSAPAPLGVGEAVLARRRYERVRETVKWSKALGRRICKRVAAGELLYAVLREEGMPTPQSVGRWAKEHSDFGRELADARRAGGRDPEGPGGGGGGVWLYSEGLAREVFERLCDGESLTAIGADPTMPCLSTLFHWRRRFPAFEEQVTIARRIQAERFCEEGMDIARAATPETAYATHVLLTQIRWAAGVMAPRVFRLKQAEPPEAPKHGAMILSHYKVEPDPETGEMVMAVYEPDPENGSVLRRVTGPARRPEPGEFRWKIG